MSWCPQDPPKWCTVAPATADVPAEVVARIQREADGGLAELRPVFAGLPKTSFRIAVHRTMASLDPEVAAALHPQVPGVALLGRHSIHLVLANMKYVENGLTRPVVVHEIVHELLDQLAGPYSGDVPRWLHEGLAQTLAGDTYLGGREEDLIWRIPSGQLLPFDDLRKDFPRDEIGLRLAYAQSYSYVSWLVQRLGVEDLLAAVQRMDQRTSFLGALVQVTRTSTIQLEEGWRDYLLHDSGARSRALLDSCFYLSMIFALPLVALAMIRRFRSDRRARERMQREEELEEERRQLAEMQPDERDGEPE